MRLPSRKPAVSRPVAWGPWLAVALLLLAPATPFPPLTVSGAEESAGFRVAPERLPEFHSTAQQDWINTEPLARADLRGKVVLLEFWTTS